jgi:tetratricopeptide (TPR) repeat protein
MQDLNLQPKMIGRENELKELHAHLNKASKGHGNTIFISGEAGIGKTRLVNELKQIAQERGFQILSGNSMYESLTPFMPIQEALRSGGLESLFAEEAPRVEAIYLVTHSGLLIKEVVREKTKLDPDIFSSLLTTVNEFVSQSLSTLLGEEKKGTLSSMGLENFRILIENGKNINLAVIISGKENEFLINDMRDIINKVHNNFDSILENWDGDEENVAGIKQILEPLIESGKYDGIYYGREDPKARRNLLFENVSLGLTRQAKLKPTLMCIEDLQWADPSSLALLHYVARNTRESGLLIMGSYRPEDIVAMDGKSHPLVGTMELMDHENLYEKIDISRLPEESIDEFLSSLLKDVDFHPEFRNKIYTETEGNPLFLIELVKFLVDDKIIETYDGIWKLAKPLKEGSLPSKVLKVISRRLNRLEKEDRKILDYASVMGEFFDSNLLATVLEMERVYILERLRYLDNTHRLIHPQNGNFKFDHAKIKEALYNEVPEELKKEYHSIIADSIEALNKDNLEKVIEDLAFNYYHSKNKDKALLYLLKAADKAKKDYSNEEAIKFYNFALEFEDHPEKRSEIFENLGVICGLKGDYEKSIKYFENALNLIQDNSKKIEIEIKIGDAYVKLGKFDDAQKRFIRLMKLGHITGVKEEALTLDAAGRMHTDKGEFEKALEYLDKSLKIWETINEPRGYASSLSSIGLVHYLRGEYDKALLHREKSLNLRTEIGDLPGVALTLDYIGVVYNWSGYYDRALKYYQKSLAIGEKTGDLFIIAQSNINLGLVHSRKEDYETSLDFYTKSLEIAERINLQFGISGIHWGIGDLYRKWGKYDKALHHFKITEQLSSEIGAQMWLTYTYCGLAELYFEKRDFENAANFCTRAFDLSNKIQLKESIARARRISGKIYREQKKWEDSLLNFQESIKLFGMIGMKHELAKSHFELALMWKAKREPEKANEHLNKASNLFVELNLENELKRVKSELETYRNGMDDIINGKVNP